MAQTERVQRRQRTGRVVSNRMDKTITVAVDRQVKHAIYGKFITKTTKYMAHDEKNEANEGDMVKIMSTRPLSKRKTWRLVKIIERAKGILMKELGVSEDEAYKKIHKKSMDLRKTMKEIAEAIILSSELRKKS